MATSKKRGGAKAHAKKVQQRNQTIKSQKNAFQKIMTQQMEELKKQYAEQQSQGDNAQNVEIVSQ
jgi:hypothetical protein